MRQKVLNTEQLRKILEFEASKGYLDTAVAGGLDKLLARLSMADYESISPPSPRYNALTPDQREKWVKSTLKRLSRPPRPSRPPTSPPPQSPKKTKAAIALGQGPVSLDSPITAIKGVTAKLANKLSTLGVSTVRDLLYFFPRRHIDYSQRSRIADLELGVEQTVIARVWQASQKKSFRGMRSTEAIIGDETGTMRAIWFNQPYLAKSLTPNTEIALSGKVDIFKGQKVFQSPQYEFIRSGDLIHTGRLVPVYPLTSGLYPRQVRKAVKDALDLGLSQIVEDLPHEVRVRANLMGLAESIGHAHYPESEALRDAARHRLAFDELFLIQLGVFERRRRREEGVKGIEMEAGDQRVEDFLTSLPFKLTSAQRRSLDEIRRDLIQSKPMSRLLQGDVGSGKTVVATAAMLLAVASGHQAALMAPTEILAEQHFQNIRRLLEERGSPIQTAILTGSIGAKEKRELHRRIAGGEIDILIGTHALIQKKVEFKDLGLAVVDEQHRFGVMQRLELQQKGSRPHVLVMSATPIPRTLALTLYGDLDVSVIDELPPGRKEIKTKWLSPRQRQSGYQFVRKQIREGRQAFIVCPLVEESENIEAKAATTEYERLSREVFPDLKLGLLHGRMSAADKEEVMGRFRDREIDILVSTSVVEVGVDVPNATVMLVEGADRFGLSQLHQFRGRVFRSSYQSYCML
ncbi:MAG: ATP-dependent DNA helicase RecG, partial [Dehalococcoidia bacterium]|nr:ATP-dependent DNA helicase RecG [Dehalococcoidia bacterium]